MIKRTCFIGTGGCGNKLLNELLSINPTVHSVFVNSNINEIKKLKNFDSSLGNYLDIKGNGTGRDQDIAEESLEMDRPRIGKFFFDLIGDFDTYVILTSLDGGFGSGSVRILASAIYNLNYKHGYNVNINVIGVMPKKNTRKQNLDNTLKSYNKLMELQKEGIISSIQFIDNNKMENQALFNKEVMKQINTAYTINNVELDGTDAMRINNAPGYKVILSLERNESGDLNEAINDAIENSNFVLPKNIGKCTHIGASFIEDDFDVNDVLDKFNILKFDKTDNNIFNNIIVLGGTAMPVKIIKEYEEESLKREMEIEEENELEETYVATVSFESKKDKTKTAKVKKELSREEMMKLYADLW